MRGSAVQTPPPDWPRPEITVDVDPAHPTVTGHGFLPGHGVPVRGVEPADIVGYFRYSADVDGTLAAPLPPTRPRGTSTVAATDERPNPADDTGRPWTNPTVIDW